MQVGAVNNFSNFNRVDFGSRKVKNNGIPEKRETLAEQQTREQHRSCGLQAARDYALGAMALGSVLAACDKLENDDINVFHKHEFKCECPTETINDTVYIKEYVPGETIYATDTIYKDRVDTVFVDRPDTIYQDRIDTVFVDRPGITDTVYVTKHDTIPVIVHDTITNTVHDTIYVDKPIYIPGDTVYIRPNFDSEVADTLNKDLGDLDIVDNPKGIPVNMVFYDEWENNANVMKFNGRASSINTLVYDDKMTGWYGDEMHSRVKFSIAKGKGLVMEVMSARGNGKPNSELDWKHEKTYLLVNANRNHLNKYEQQEDGSLKYVGTITKGDKPRSTFNNTELSNGEVETWRYSDWKVKHHDVKYDEMYNEYIEKNDED